MKKYWFVMVCVMCVACEKDLTHDTAYKQLAAFGQKLITECRDVFNGYPMLQLAQYTARGKIIYYETLKECQPARPVPKVEK